MRRINKDITRQIVQMYTEQEFPAPKIAKILGIGTTTVYRYLKSNGVNPSQYGRIGKGNKGYKFSDETERRICQEYKSGKSLAVLANTHSCALVTISKIVKRRGGKVRRQGGPKLTLTTTQQEEILHLYQSQGLSQEAVAGNTSVSVKRIQRCLEQHGIVSHTRRERHGSWKGGGITTSSGYIMVRPPYNHPFCNMVDTGGYVAEHRFVMAEALNRPLHPWETVHHIDGNPGNNKLDNLQLRIGKHGKHISYRCSDCGSTKIEPRELD